MHCSILRNSCVHIHGSQANNRHAAWQGRFAEAAFAARGGNSGVKPLALLNGKRVYVHVAEAAKKGPSTGNGGALRRLVTALGGKVQLLATVFCIDSLCRQYVCLVCVVQLSYHRHSADTFVDGTW